MPTGPFFVNNQCTSGEIYGGIVQKLYPSLYNGPTYLSSYGGSGITSFNPSNSVLVFFDPDLQTGMLFQGSIPNSVEVEYTPSGMAFQTAVLGDNNVWSVNGNIQEKRS